jgi:hypothetical protein
MKKWSQKLFPPKVLLYPLLEVVWLWKHYGLAMAPIGLQSVTCSY